MLTRAEKIKCAKYSDSALELNATFVPFLVSLQGQIGPSAAALLKELEERATTPLGIDYRLLLTLTIQRASARAQAWVNMRDHSTRWRRREI